MRVMWLAVRAGAMFYPFVAFTFPCQGHGCDVTRAAPADRREVAGGLGVSGGPMSREVLTMARRRGKVRSSGAVLVGGRSAVRCLSFTTAGMAADLMATTRAGGEGE